MEIQQRKGGCLKNENRSTPPQLKARTQEATERRSQFYKERISKYQKDFNKWLQELQTDMRVRPYEDIIM